MDLGVAYNFNQEQNNNQQGQGQGQILCAQCGTVINPNPANLCVNCVRAEVDITEGIPKQGTVHFCKGCDRYLQPPNVWVKADLESRELLALLLKKLKGLSKVKLIDASFIWTEPHSKRLKIKLTIQKEVFAQAVLQQIFIVEFIVAGQHCEECQRVDAQNTWKACVQVRQKVTHKRTFLWLEQVILKHNAHKDTVNIKEFRDGLDFFYVQRSHAIKMVDFLQSVVPLKIKTSEQLISQDIHSGTNTYKFTYSIEIVPICKDDLVCLPLKIARQLSNVNPLVLCSKVSNTVFFHDFESLKTVDLRSSSYWNTPFPSLMESADLVEFYVIDVQDEGKRVGKYALSTIEVCKTSNMSQTYLIRTHLGNVLNPGDHCLGYDLTNVNFNSDAWAEFIKDSKRLGTIPDVVIVKKSYPHARKKQRGRAWRIKSMAKEEELDLINRSKAEKARQDVDYELFLRDIEEDSEFRSNINIYKNEQHNINNIEQKDEMENDDDMEEEEEEDFPEIDIQELLDDIEGMNLEDDDE